MSPSSADPFGLRTESPAGYVRTDPRPLDGGAPDVDAQQRQIRRHADAQGWPEPEWFVDRDAHGTDLDRIDLRRLVTSVADGFVTTVIVHALPRLSTRRAELLGLVDTYFAPNGVTLVSLREGIDTSTPRGEAMLETLRAFVPPRRTYAADDPQGTAVERIRETVLDGGHAGGRIPYGYHRGPDGRLTPHPEDADVVRRIYRLRAHDQSLRAIASRLNDRGIAAPSGGPWRASTVRYILKNEVYYGYRTYTVDGETLTQDVPHLQILDS